MRGLRRNIVFIGFVLVAFSLSGQETDTIHGSILPYYIPTHSDRPGNTFDPLPIHHGIQIQAGYGYQDRILGWAQYMSTQLRIATCIGEFDVELSGLTNDVSTFVNNDVIYADYEKREAELHTGVWYRNGMQFGDDLKLGFITGVTIGRKGFESTNIGRLKSTPDTTQNDTAINGGYRTVYGGRINLNGSYSITEHWGIASSLGFVTYDVKSQTRPRTTLTLNLSFSDEWLTTFVEVFTTDLGVSYARFNLGGSVNLTRNLIVDMYYSTKEGQFEISNGIIHAGFTYVL